MNTLPQSTLPIQNVLTDIFVTLDDTLKKEESVGRKPTLSVSECLTIVLLKYALSIQNWKAVYKHVKEYHLYEFPRLGSYKSFVQCINKSMNAAAQLLHSMIEVNKEKRSGITLVDSTPLPVCRIHREKMCQQAKDVAEKGKHSLGWYYGLKLHLACDLNGDILDCQITPPSVGDRDYLKQLFLKLKGIFVADSGYLGKEIEEAAAAASSILITAKRKNMKSLATSWQVWHLQNRIRIESVFANLKLRSGLIAALPRSLNGLSAHYLLTLFAYQFNKSVIS